MADVFKQQLDGAKKGRFSDPLGVDLYIPVTKRNGDVEYISKRESSKNETSNGQLSVMLGGHGMMDRVLADLRASDAVTRFNKNKCIRLYHHPDDGAYDYVRLLDLKSARAAVGYQDSSSTEHISVPRPRYRKYGEKIQQFEEFGFVLAALRRTAAELHVDESEIPEDMFNSVLGFNYQELDESWLDLGDNCEQNNDVVGSGSVQQQWQLPSQATVASNGSQQQVWQLPSQTVAAAYCGYGSVQHEQQLHSQTLAADAGSGSVQQDWQLPSQTEVATVGSVPQQQWQMPSQATVVNVRTVQQDWQLPSQAVAAARGSESVHLSTSGSRLPGPPAHTLMFGSPLSPARASALISNIPKSPASRSRLKSSGPSPGGPPTYVKRSRTQGRKPNLTDLTSANWSADEKLWFFQMEMNFRRLNKEHDWTAFSTAWNYRVNTEVLSPSLAGLQTVAQISLKTPTILAKFAEQVAKDGLSQRGVSSIALSTAINVASTSQSQVQHQLHSTQLSALPSPLVPLTDLQPPSHPSTLTSASPLHFHPHLVQQREHQVCQQLRSFQELLNPHASLGVTRPASASVDPPSKKLKMNKCGPCSHVKGEFVPAKNHNCPYCKGCWGKGLNRTGQGIVMKIGDCSKQKHKK